MEGKSPISQFSSKGGRIAVRPARARSKLFELQGWYLRPNEIQDGSRARVGEIEMCGEVNMQEQIHARREGGLGYHYPSIEVG